MPLDAARDAVIAMQATVIQALAAENVRLAGQVADLAARLERLRSGQTTRHRYAIRGYLSTAAKHSINVLAALRDALDGHPWMPPIPDPP